MTVGAAGACGAHLSRRSSRGDRPERAPGCARRHHGDLCRRFGRSRPTPPPGERTLAAADDRGRAGAACARAGRHPRSSPRRTARCVHRSDVATPRGRAPGLGRRASGRNRGQRGQVRIGGCSVAAAVHDRNGVVAAVSVSGPSSVAGGETCEARWSPAVRIAASRNQPSTGRLAPGPGRRGPLDGHRQLITRRYRRSARGYHRLNGDSPATVTRGLP